MSKQYDQEYKENAVKYYMEHKESHQNYGAPKITEILKKQGDSISVSYQNI